MIVVRYDRGYFREEGAVSCSCIFSGPSLAWQVSSSASSEVGKLYS